MIEFSLFTFSEIGGDIEIVIYFTVFDHFDSFIFVAVNEIRGLFRQGAGIVNNGDFGIFIESGFFLDVGGSSKTDEVNQANHEGNEKGRGPEGGFFELSQDFEFGYS